MNQFFETHPFWGRLLFAFVLILAATFAHAQGAMSTGNPVATNGVGQPMAGITVAICNANPGASPSSLCSGGTLVPTYTDITLGHACSGTLTALNNQFNSTVGSGCSNPGLTDGQGNVVAFGAQGNYWCEYQGPPIVGIVVTVCSFPAAGGALFYQIFSSNGSIQIQRPQANFISGSNSTVNCVDNAGQNRTDCTVSSSAGGGNPTLDNCTPDQSGFTFYSVTQMPALGSGAYFYDASWVYCTSTSTCTGFTGSPYVNCSVHFTAAQTLQTITLLIATSDTTNTHTANFQTCDAFVATGSTLNVASLTCAAAQTFTVPSTAYTPVPLIFNVQSTISGAGVLVVKILTVASGTAPTAVLLVYPTFQ